MTALELIPFFLMMAGILFLIARPLVIYAALYTERFLAVWARKHQRKAADKGEKRKQLRDYISFLVSLIVLIAALFVILSGLYEDGTQRWAFGAIGTIVGYWLQPAR